MKNIFFVFGLLIVLFTISCKKQEVIQPKEQVYAIVIHGGAGTITKNMPIEQQEAYQNALKKAIDKGYAILNEGGSSLEAVQRTINLLEDSPLFNAGKGAVFDSEGKNKMDASIMDGKTLNTGAVAGVSNIKNPINAARLVMDSTKHVLLSGKGAEIFAQQHHVKFESDEYFHTERAYKSWLNVRNNEKQKQHSAGRVSSSTNNNNNKLANNKILNSKTKKHKHFGTVGVVALDKNGNIAAGTSTGGLTYKKYGRIGDSPIIGAGTYANNKTCGVSCTGVGEYYIRTLAAHEISSLIQYKNLNVKEAANEVIHNQIGKLGGIGGIIVLDKNGNIAWDFNTKGMYRAFKKSTGEEKVKLFEMELEE